MNKSSKKILIVTIRNNNDADKSNSVTYNKHKVTKDPLEEAYKIALLFNCVQSDSYEDASEFIGALIRECGKDIESNCKLKFNESGRYKFNKRLNGHVECVGISVY